MKKQTEKRKLGAVNAAGVKTPNLFVSVPGPEVAGAR
jgi:hypothetical protein